MEIQCKELRYEFKKNRDKYFENYKHECVNCGKETDLILHHIVPLALGGSNKLTNIVVLCEECHNKIHGNSYSSELKKQRITQLKKDKENGTINTKSGKWFGRQEKQVEDLPKDFKKYYDMVQAKTITKVECAKMLGIGRATLYRWIKLYEEVKY